MITLYNTDTGEMKQIASNGNLITDKVEAGNMAAVTSNAVSEILPKFQLTTIPSAYTYNHRPIKLWKYGEIKCISIDGITNVPISTEVTIAQLPDAYMPLKEVIYDGIGVDNTIYRLFIHTYGEVDIYLYKNAAESINTRIFLTYI